MGTAQQKAVSNHRQRKKHQGIMRLEVQVRKDDAQLVRDVVGALGDPERATEARLLLRDHFSAAKVSGLKALLASAPLEGVDLSRERDHGRDIEL